MPSWVRCVEWTHGYKFRIAYSFSCASLASFHNGTEIEHEFKPSWILLDVYGVRAEHDFCQT
jgi:hypothetical protein